MLDKSRFLSVLFVAATVGGCGAPDPEAVGEETEALVTDPFQYVFAVRRSSPYAFTIEPAGNFLYTCLNGVPATSCQTSRLNLTPTGLSVAKQQEIINRIATEPAGDASNSVLLKGNLVTVRDRRTNPPTTYDEFRATAAYMAPTARSHATTYLWVDHAVNTSSGVVYHYYYVNTDLSPSLPRTIYVAPFTWVGPAAETPASYPNDSFVTSAAYGTSHQINQLFRRVTN